MKHSKKSLFITTIMMVVLLVAALSTATYAWYTSSNTVNTTITEVNSAESKGANISIGWLNNTPAGVASMTFADNTTEYQPLAPLTGGSTFDIDTPFYTAVTSFGNLINHSSTSPYIGKNESNAEVFYVINYARVATNVKFSANVTGANAARLRIAVFAADGTTEGTLVYTNAGYYTGEIIATVPTQYNEVLEEPTDWADAFGTAKYSSATGSYVKIPAVAPKFVNNMYYDAGNLTVALINEPSDWGTNWAAYSQTANFFTSVAGVAPAFGNQTVYQVIPEVPEHMKTGSIVSPIAIDTTIAASDGVVGAAQGFTVKAWFDGPTQVDAYGGMSAFFTLTVTASVG